MFLKLISSGIDAPALLGAVGDLLTKLNDRKLGPDDVLTADVISSLQSVKENWIESMTPYRTAMLWVMYMNLVAILRSFIQSARTGNWKLYLQSLHEMLPYLAASGHNNYVKSLVLFLDKMKKLEQTNPTVHAKFLEGLFVL